MQITCAEVKLFKPCSERILTSDSHSKHTLKLFVSGDSTALACDSGAFVTYLSLSATKITRRSKRREAKILMIWRTLRHLKRHSKSTCSRRESIGRRSSMTWTHSTGISQCHWSGLIDPGARRPWPRHACWGDKKSNPHPFLETESGGITLQRNSALHSSLSCHVLPRIQTCIKSTTIS